MHPRDHILRLLREAQAGTGWVSGERMSDTLDMSRAAISKHVRILREAGYDIASLPRRGYCLKAEAEQFSEGAVRAALDSRLLGQRGWLWLGETASTNTEAALRAMEGAPEGTVIVAERQMRGRGRRGHNWFSAPRSLAFSVILRPQAPTTPERLTLLAQHAVASAVEEQTGLRPLRKLPNDLLLDGRKFCGVLVEAGYRGSDMDWAVVGIGVNVNAREEDFAGSLADAATSLYAASGRRQSRARLLARILEHLEAGYLPDSKGTAMPDAVPERP